MSLINTEFERLKLILVRMSQHVEKTLNNVKELLEAQDIERRRVIWREVEDFAITLESMRRDFIDEALLFIARRQPLGEDLVSTHIMINIAYDVYRISRYCREIAKVDSLLAPSSGLSSIPSIRELFEKSVIAVKVALKDLVEFSSRRISVVDEIDTYMDRTYQEILQELVSNKVVPRELGVKALIARHVERIVDHAQYIEQHLSKL